MLSGQSRNCASVMPEYAASRGVVEVFEVDDRHVVFLSVADHRTTARHDALYSTDPIKHVARRDPHGRYRQNASRTPRRLYWGTRKANPGYCYGLALDVGADGLAAELVYVMSDLDENDEPLVTPETLVSCFTVNDLEDNGIILSNYLDDEDAPEAVGWYCIEKSFFGRDNVEALLDNNARLDGHLDIVLQILLISPEEVAQGMPSLDELSFFDLLEELEGVAEPSTTATCSRRCPFRSASWATTQLGKYTPNEGDFR